MWLTCLRRSAAPVERRHQITNVAAGAGNSPGGSRRKARHYANRLSAAPIGAFGVGHSTVKRSLVYVLSLANARVAAVVTFLSASSQRTENNHGLEFWSTRRLSRLMRFGSGYEPQWSQSRSRASRALITVAQWSAGSSRHGDVADDSASSRLCVATPGSGWQAATPLPIGVVVRHRRPSVRPRRSRATRRIPDTMSVASVVGAIGFWNFMKIRTGQKTLSEAYGYWLC